MLNINFSRININIKLILLKFIILKEIWGKFLYNKKFFFVKI